MELPTTENGSSMQPMGRACTIRRMEVFTRAHSRITCALVTGLIRTRLVATTEAIGLTIYNKDTALSHGQARQHSKASTWQEPSKAWESTSGQTVPPTTVNGMII